MRVIFCDFDGVLNNEGSFVYESRRRKQWKLQGIKGPIDETFCNVCASNLQVILDRYRDVRIVVSSTWRELLPMEQIKEIFKKYHLNPALIIGETPVDIAMGNRGIEIKMYLHSHPEITHYVIIDDNDWGITEHHGVDKFVKTSWEYGGLTWGHAQEVIKKLKTPKKVKP